MHRYREVLNEDTRTWSVAKLIFIHSGGRRDARNCGREAAGGGRPGGGGGVRESSSELVAPPMRGGVGSCDHGSSGSRLLSVPS